MLHETGSARGAPSATGQGSTTSTTARPRRTLFADSARRAGGASVWWPTAPATGTRCVLCAARAPTGRATRRGGAQGSRTWRTPCVPCAARVGRGSMRCRHATRTRGTHRGTPCVPAAPSAQRISTFRQTAARRLTQCVERARSVGGATLWCPTAASMLTRSAGHAHDARQACSMGRLDAWGPTRRG